MESRTMKLRRLARSDRGSTLIELIVVMAIMLVILAGLTDGFASISRAEVDQTNLANDQQSARQALQRMRLDIHCASAVQGPQLADPLNPTGGYIITFTETPSPSGATAGCPGVSTSSSGVQWCTNYVGANRYQLFRSDSACVASAANFEVDYITSANIWTASTCTVGQYPTVGVDMTVNRDPIKRPTRTYELKDAIALRNAPPPTSCS
jgi:prepilin-type N-terminal cleavage/methylation domain-containing protein